ncbi:MAG: hypothetical protein JWO38_7450 [Gemmataceae bacterium]|nr:hypothetical protein [Gemmataceae bacterium]
MGRETAVWALGFIWIAAVAGGFWVWERYDVTAGGVRLPPAVAADPAPGRWQLTLLAHPRCPCTRATLGELAEVLREAPGLSARVVFVRPAETADGWERGESWDVASWIPGVEVATDPDGAEARRYGAETSGQAVLSDPTGRVVFRGGLTKTRGLTGESPGRRAVLAWVEGGAGPAGAPVFGCALFAPGE